MILAVPTRTDLTPHRKQDALSGFMRRISLSDLLVIIWAVGGAQLIRFGSDPADGLLSSRATTTRDLKYFAFSLALVVVWMGLLRMHGAYDRRLLGHGPEEYKVVATASFQLFALVAIISYLLRLEVARGYVALAMPAGMLGLLGGAVVLAQVAHPAPGSGTDVGIGPGRR